MLDVGTRLTTMTDPLEDVVWERRDIEIRDAKGHIAFEQKNVEVPVDWDDVACRIAVHKYFYGNVGDQGRETSIKQMIYRVAAQVAAWGFEQGYFISEELKEEFYSDLAYILVRQIAAFNTPVWLNVGVSDKPTCSACFISSLEDTLESIEELYKTEMEIFRGGSGNGVNLSPLRGSMEKLSRGGVASGPIPFAKALDFACGAMRSGGRARRGALMRRLDIDHPDILEFINLKQHAEQIAHSLIEAGFDPDWDTGIYKDIPWQNANNSVGLTDTFMEAVESGEKWNLIGRVSGKPIAVHEAKDMMLKLSEAAWTNGCPGVQFHDTINKWHTCKTDGEIVASNPCSEYLFLNDTSCNLASINLLKVLNEDGLIDIEMYERVIRTMITAQDILVDNSHYPNEKITKETRKYRTLGLGYANLGALLMRMGLPYDSEDGRRIAASLTSFMTAVAYDQSAHIAENMGAFDRYAANAEHIRHVLKMHAVKMHAEEYHIALNQTYGTEGEKLRSRAVNLFIAASERPLRNAQVTVLAPTGTIGLLMGCDTTGVEPDLALIKYKQIHGTGGGKEKIFNQSVSIALKNLGYGTMDRDLIHQYILDHDGALTNCPEIHLEHLPIFATSLGENRIAWEGHVKMMIAVQPFLSGAISKCVTGATLIPTSRGMVPISKFYNEELPDTFKSLSETIISIDGQRNTDQFYCGGFQKTIRVKTRQGFEIEGTPNHKLLVSSNEEGLIWKQLDEIEKGDYVAQRFGDRMWSSQNTNFEFELGGDPKYHTRRKQICIPDQMTSELAWFFGAFISEGCFNELTWAVSIANNCPIVQKRIQACFRDLFGLQSRLVKAGGWSTEVNSRTLVEFLKYCGIKTGSYHKDVPWSILESTEVCVRAFIEGAFLDGNVTVSAIQIGSASEILLKQYQILLVNFGIRSWLKGYPHKYHGKMFYQMKISGEEAQKFAILFTFDEPWKEEKTEVLRTRKFKSSWSDVVPHITCESIYDSIPASIRRGKHFGSKHDNTTFGALARLVNDPSVPTTVEMDWVVQNNIHFDKIETIDVERLAEVFDFSVPETHSFVGNGIINHNTINMPNRATSEDIQKAYIMAWRFGLKAIAIYRDGSKGSQPVTTKPQEKQIRKHLPDECVGHRLRFAMNGVEVFIHTGCFEDGSLGELFITMNKSGSSLQGLLNSIAIAISIGLQHGVPVKTIVEKYRHQKFDPSGPVQLPGQSRATFYSSILDCIAHWLQLTYVDQASSQELSLNEQQVQELDNTPFCGDCGSLMIRSGTCFKCLECGTTSGCS